MDKLIKKDNTKNKKLLIISIISTIIILIGSAYAFFTYSKTANAFTLTSSSITATFTEGTNQINFANAYPISDEYAIQNLDKLDYIDFTVSGNASNPNEAVTYEIFLTEANGNTLNTNYIKTYVTDNNNNEIESPKVYNNLLSTTYTDEPTGKVVIKKTYAGQFSKSYRLYIWLDEGYEQNQVSETFSCYVNIYAYNDVPNAAEKIIKRYNGSGQDGLYAVNTSGDLYDGTGTIREYRYSGATPNNYIYFNGNELWRIVGVFNEKLKIVKDTAITDVPTNYTHTDPRTNVATEFILKRNELTFGSGLYWNKHVDTNITDNNDWTTAGLQYYLNDTNNTNSYYYSINSAYKNLIKTNTIYYLGNVTSGTEFPAKTIYEQERGTTVCGSSVASYSHSNSCNIWNGNQASWEGAIGLLYPSDYGYANATNLWSVNLNTYSANDFKHNNWILDPNATSGYWWFISPSSGNSRGALYWNSSGKVDNCYVSPYQYSCGGTFCIIDLHNGARPVLNLKTDTKIYDGDGSIDHPYTLIAPSS